MAEDGSFAVVLVEDLRVGRAELEELHELGLDDLVRVRRRAPASEELRVLRGRVAALVVVRLRARGARRLEGLQLREEPRLVALEIAPSRERAALGEQHPLAFVRQRHAGRFLVLEALDVVLGSEAEADEHHHGGFNGAIALKEVGTAPRCHSSVGARPVGDPRRSLKICQ